MSSEKSIRKEYRAPESRMESLSYEVVVCGTDISFAQPSHGVEVKETKKVSVSEEGYSNYFEF